MSRLLIIGYGNPLRGDDGLGWHAAERLRDRITDPEVEVRAVHQLTPELSDPLSRAGRAVFIDAAAEGEPGAIERRSIEPAAGETAFTHQATPEALLAAARALFGRAPEAVLFSVPVESTELGAGLTPKVADALETIVLEISAMAQ
jgi:hydrogenase maturation protease